uniref:Major facilitator superfamily (MFS) profile domain-containing protein n=1 Tax=uncultured Thiotrichaceae bacterium TaxID=298394 RepID=A0A6S6UGF2_9GAMM|nr:MAG: Unknown protein [uncultured Thiotrichaceae bacterium]
MNSQASIDQRALRAVAVQFLINGAVAASYIPRLPEIRDSLGVDLAVIGQALTIASLGGLLGSWLAGRVITAIGTRQVMIYGTLLLVVLLPMIALASSIWVLLLVMAAIMLVDVIVDVAMNIQGSNLSARRSTPVMNRLHGLWSIGSVIGGVLAASMAALLIPLQWHLLGAAALMAMALWYIGGGLLTSDQVIPDEGSDKSGIKKPKARVPISLWVFAVLGGATFIPEMVASDWSPFRLSDDLQAGAGLAGIAYVAFTTGMVAGRLSGDWASAKLGKDRLLKYAIVVAAIGLGLACLVDYTPVVFASLTLAGVGISVLFPALYDNAAQDPHRPAAALGAMTAGSRGAMLIAPLAIGFLANSSLFSVGMAMAVLALPCLLIVGYLTVRFIHVERN